MDKTSNVIPDVVNQRRRQNLNRYTLLAILSYQFPVGVAFLATVLHTVTYDYVDILYAYGAYVSFSLIALVLIRLKNQITKAFIYFILDFQAIGALIISGYLVYVMNEHRYLVPLGCLLILVFMFIQSTMLVSLVSIFLTVTMYLVTSYISIVLCGHPGSFISDVLYVLMFAPVSVAIAYMATILQKQQKKIKNANSILKTTHAELEATHAELESHNERMTDSLRYAEMIQRSLLPGIERIKAVSTDSMFIWIPKDIVGGDIFYTYADPEESLIALMDCTGHGVPGAFLTMIVYSEIRKIIMDDACRKPSDILKRLNKAVKNVLHKNNQDNRANDGLDAAVCVIDHSAKRVTYAGARVPLFYMMDGTLHMLTGDKQSIGYKDSDDEFEFTNHIIDVDAQCAFYMKTDGFTDQLGGEKKLRFGTNRFKQLIEDNYDAPFSGQRKNFLKALLSYQGDNDQIDDITLIGFYVS